VEHEAYAGDRGNIKRDVFYLKPTVGTPLKPYVAMYIVRAHATVIAGNISYALFNVISILLIQLQFHFCETRIRSGIPGHTCCLINTVTLKIILAKTRYVLIVVATYQVTHV